MQACQRTAGASSALVFTTVRGRSRRCFKASRQPPRAPLYTVRATEEGSEGKNGLDWDKAWSGFVDGLNKNIPVVEDRTVNRPEQPKKASSSRSPQFAKDSRRSLRENIKKQENIVLDFWSQESFFKLGGVLIVLCLVAFLVVGPGRPPE